MHSSKPNCLVIPNARGFLQTSYIVPIAMIFADDSSADALSLSPPPRRIKYGARSEFQIRGCASSFPSLPSLSCPSLPSSSLSIFPWFPPFLFPSVPSRLYSLFHPRDSHHRLRKRLPIQSGGLGRTMWASPSSTPGRPSADKRFLVYFELKIVVPS